MHANTVEVLVCPQHEDLRLVACKHNPLLVLHPGLKPGENEHQQSALWNRKGWELSQGRRLPLSIRGTTVHLPLSPIQLKEHFKVEESSGSS